VARVAPTAPTVSRVPTARQAVPGEPVVPEARAGTAVVADREVEAGKSPSSHPLKNPSSPGSWMRRYRAVKEETAGQVARAARAGKAGPPTRRTIRGASPGKPERRGPRGGGGRGGRAGAPGPRPRAAPAPSAAGAGARGRAP